MIWLVLAGERRANQNSLSLLLQYISYALIPELWAITRYNHCFPLRYPFATSSKELRRTQRESRFILDLHITLHANHQIPKRVRRDRVP